MQQEVDPNVVLQKFQYRLSEALTANIVLETRLEQALAQLEKLNQDAEEESLDA